LFVNKFYHFGVLKLIARFGTNVFSEIVIFLSALSARLGQLDCLQLFQIKLELRSE